MFLNSLSASQYANPRPSAPPSYTDCMNEKMGFQQQVGQITTVGSTNAHFNTPKAVGEPSAGFSNNLTKPPSAESRQKLNEVERIIITGTINAHFSTPKAGEEPKASFSHNLTKHPSAEYRQEIKEVVISGERADCTSSTHVVSNSVSKAQGSVIGTATTVSNDSAGSPRAQKCTCNDTDVWLRLPSAKSITNSGKGIVTADLNQNTIVLRNEGAGCMKASGNANEATIYENAKSAVDTSELLAPSIYTYSIK
jgi:hypothetical protein